MLNLFRIFAIRRRGSATPLDDFMLRLRIAAVVLGVYWLALFISTHMPPGPVLTHRVLPLDKVAHFCGYGLLAVLFAWTAIGIRKPSIMSMLILWGVIVLYGAFDELTQAFVRRTPDPMDWLADAMGAMLGLAAYGLCVTLWLRRRQPSTNRTQ